MTVTLGLTVEAWFQTPYLGMILNPLWNKNKLKKHLLTRNNNDRDIGLTVEAWLTGIQARVFKVDWWNGQSWDQGYFLQSRLIVIFAFFTAFYYNTKQNKPE